MTKEEYKKLLSNAVIFYNTAKLLTDSFNEKILTNKGEAASFFISSIINYAFSSELFMKAVLKYNGTNYKNIHLLDKLFEIYPSDLKNDIYKRFNTSFQINHIDFDKKLKSISNVFVDWRYFVFNNKSLTIDNVFLVNFCISLRKQAFSLLDL